MVRNSIGVNSKLAFPETKLAIIPGAGGTWRLTKTVGSSLAKRMIILGESLTGQLAFENGSENLPNF